MPIERISAPQKVEQCSTRLVAQGLVLRTRHIAPGVSALALAGVVVLLPRMIFVVACALAVSIAALLVIALPGRLPARVLISKPVASGVIAVGGAGPAFVMVPTILIA